MNADGTIPIQAALCGLGRIALSDHLPQLTGNVRFKLVAVADTLEERCREVCEKYAVPRAWGSLEELLEQEKIELLVLASPTNFHASQAIMALGKGVHVFCDKPVASTAADTERMFDAAKRSGAKMVYQPAVFSRGRICQGNDTGGKLGRVFQFKIFLQGVINRRNDWQAIRAKRWGMLLNYGAHIR